MQYTPKPVNSCNMLLCSCVCISTAQVGVIETCGRFERTQHAGCGCLGPVQSLKGVLSLRVEMVDLAVESKTLDNALVRVQASIHYRVLRDRVEEAYYKFSNPQAQIMSFASNVIRGQVPKYTIDDIFLLRDEMQKALREELEEKLAAYGFEIVATLITDIDPSDEVKQAMSQINTNARLREAASYEADTAKIKLVKAAEAEAEAKRLSGVGLAEQRKAAVHGLQSSVRKFSEKVEGIDDKEIMALLMMNQYFDALKDIAQTGRNAVVFMPNNTGSGAGMEATQNMLAALAAKK